MTERMGFEKDRRIMQDHKNTWHGITLCDTRYHVRSGLERDWAAYLQFLWESGEILLAEYEPHTFTFAGEVGGATKYTPDFRITTHQEQYWQECKGHHDGPTNTKLKRMAKHYPDEIIELVLQRIPKNGKDPSSRRKTAARYTRRIIDASVIFKQIRGLLK